MLGRKTIVSGEHLIAIVPPVRVLNSIRVHVPAVVVPVHVDRAKRAGYSRIQNHLYHHPPNYSGLNLMWDLKVRRFYIPILVIF